VVRDLGKVWSAIEFVHANAVEMPMNGDQTDWGLNFTTVPHVFRVTLGTYYRAVVPEQRHPF
jgi:hypothetical protein